MHLHATHSHSVTSTQRNKRSRCSLAQTPEPRETERLAAQRVKNVVPVRGTRRPRQASERNRQEGSPYSCGCSGHTQEPLRHVRSMACNAGDDRPSTLTKNHKFKFPGPQSQNRVLYTDSGWSNISAALAQSIPLQTENDEVAGSSPVTTESHRSCRNSRRFF